MRKAITPHVISAVFSLTTFAQIAHNIYIVCSSVTSFHSCVITLFSCAIKNWTVDLNIKVQVQNHNHRLTVTHTETRKGAGEKTSCHSNGQIHFLDRHSVLSPDFRAEHVYQSTPVRCEITRAKLWMPEAVIWHTRSGATPWRQWFGLPLTCLTVWPHCSALIVTRSTVDFPREWTFFFLHVQVSPLSKLKWSSMCWWRRQARTWMSSMVTW